MICFFFYWINKYSIVSLIEISRNVTKSMECWFDYYLDIDLNLFI